MNVNKIIFKREELYERIWKTPIVRLSKEYGISDVALAKICKKLKVPRPPRGYWAKLEFKKNVHRPPLPNISPDTASEYVHIVYPIPEYEVRVDPTIRESLSVKRTIIVPSNLDNPHRLVKAAKAVLEHTKPSENGLLYEHRRPCLDIKVTPACLDRALKIMDAVIQGFEAESVAVSVGSGLKDSTNIIIDSEKVFFSIVEDYRRIDHIPTKEDNARSSWEIKRYDYHPTGKLSLNIIVNGAYGTRKIWADSKTGKLEEKVGDFLNGATLAAHVLKMERQKREEAHRKREEERRQREENDKKLAEEKARLQELERQAELWAKSEKIRRFILAVETAAASRDMPEEQRKGIVAWIAWARKRADQMDPIKLTFPE